MAIFAVVALIAGAVMVFGYHRAAQPVVRRRPLQGDACSCPRRAACTERGNVTYRGTEVGRVKSVHLTDTGVEAVLSLDPTSKIPADLDAEVHSQSAVGEQYVELLPRNGNSRTAEGRRRHPGGPHHRAAGHQLAARRDQPWPAGDPAGQPENRDRRGLHRVRRSRARRSARLVKGIDGTGDRRAQEPGSS